MTSNITLMVENYKKIFLYIESFGHLWLTFNFFLLVGILVVASGIYSVQVGWILEYVPVGTSN